jgi:hypothetical protein
MDAVYYLFVILALLIGAIFAFGAAIVFVYLLVVIVPAGALALLAFHMGGMIGGILLFVALCWLVCGLGIGFMILNSDEKS